MAALNQIQLSFEPAEDRLLLRIGTDDGSEFRFWLTRRYVRLMWQVLAELSLPDPSSSAASSPAALAAVADFQRQQALAETTFADEFEDTATALPLGESPVLLTQVYGQRSADGAPILSLHPADGMGIDLALDAGLIHAFAALLDDTVGGADWQLSSPMAAPEFAGQASRALN